MFEDLIRNLLPHLAGDVKTRLIKELQALGKGMVTTQVAEQFARLITKSLDAVIATAVKHLDVADTDHLAAAYVTQIDEQIMDFTTALHDYIPKQIAVERAKKDHGADSVEANAARVDRAKFLQEVKSEVGDLLRAATGSNPKD